MKPYRLTFAFISLFILVSMGRIQSFALFLYSMPLGAISIFLSVLALYFEAKSRRESITITTTEERLVVGIFLVALLGAPFSFWPMLSIEILMKNFFPTVVMFFIISHIVFRIDEVKRIVWFYLFAATLLVINSLKSGISHGSTGSDIYDANDLALVFNITLPFCFYFIDNYRGYKKLILIVLSLLIIALVILSASRGGFLGLIVFGGYWIITSNRKLFAVLLVCAALVLIPVLAPVDTWERISTLWNPQSDYDRTAGDRTYVWERGLKTFAEHPFLGVGIGCYAIGDGQSKEEGKWMTAHNSYIQLGVELGAIGILLFLSLVCGTFIRLYRLRQNIAAFDNTNELIWLIKAIEASLIIYAVAAFFLSQAYMTQLYFILALAVVVQKKINKSTVELAKTGVSLSS